MTSQRKYQRVVKNLARNTNFRTEKGSSYGGETYFRCRGRTLLHARKTAKLNTSFMKTFLKMF